MKKRSPEDRERLRRLLEEGEAARRQMREIIDRVDARMQERAARRERGLLRRLFPR
jgi:hypothetical protein